MNKKLSIVILVFLGGSMLLTSCENPITLETVVHEDGSLDKTIAFEKADSATALSNIFGINPSSGLDSARGWSLKTVAVPIEHNGDQTGTKFNLVFKKHFGSANDANATLDTKVDSLFQVHSSFEKKFRWFYTYIRYTETYRPINRFKMLAASDYFNQEDFQFIARLPNEGQPISKADSIYLQILNTKIYDMYGTMAIFNEEYDILTRLVKKYNPDKKWLDTLRLKRDFIYRHIEKMEGDFNTISIEMADSLKIPLVPREKALADAKELSRGLNSRLSFMSFMKDGKFTNIITMPWTVVKSNADSVSGNKLFWRPPVTKFSFTEYEMYAESRKMNTWVVVASGGFVVLTLAAWLRRKK